MTEGQHKQMPPEIQQATALCQHAAGIMSDILKGGGHTRIDLVEYAFSIAQDFDARMQKEMDLAIAKLPKSPSVIQP